jgi:putative transposase
MHFHRRTARLLPENYLGRQTYFVTICCDHRAPYLNVQTSAQRVLALLLETAASHSFLLHAYCLMPDHLHVLVEGAHDTCDLLEFIRLFKQCTAFEFRKFHHRPLWEMSYYDHILRPSDHIEDVACYIWMNPVRKRLCANASEFPFSGSLTIDWIQRARSGTSWSPPWSSP